jgi:hypothetical protein
MYTHTYILTSINDKRLYIERTGLSVYAVASGGGDQRQGSSRQGRSASWWRFNGERLVNPPRQGQ